MNSITPSSINPRLDLRLAAYAAAGVALAAPAMSSTATAAVVYSGPLAIAVPQNGVGIYIDFATGVASAGTVPGYDINLYAGPSLAFYYGSQGTTVEAATTTGVPLALTVGTSIGPTSTFSTSATATNFQTTGTEYLGLKFVNTNTSAINYGWLKLATTATNGYPATITGYGFENTGAAILAGQVPEPGTTTALGFGALSLGAAGVRRWRKTRQAVA